MEQLVGMGFILGLAWLGESKKIGIYKIMAGFISFYMSVFMFVDEFLTVIFILLALYLILSVFVGGSRRK